MPRLVLIAKNTYVWLDQLSRKYQQPIPRLDQIPDEELDQLASWGFTGLWLIGLWERSSASAPHQADYAATRKRLPPPIRWLELSHCRRSGRRRCLSAICAIRPGSGGIRLASDMVPNHMGIDSPWVIEHPDWFYRLGLQPLPVLFLQWPGSFPGWAGRTFTWKIIITIAPMRRSFSNGSISANGQMRFIYHGNDGTSMPWNDTAQLNYLNPEVREAVIQTILHVARCFPIIRFDAAMTLAKKHFQRLWFPEPGTVGPFHPAPNSA